MKKYMLAPLRTEVGLGSPPAPYYQNTSECMNEVIKDQVRYKENELPDFIEKVSVLVERHKDLLRKAVATTGEWEMLPGFKYLERPDWFRMTPKQREAHMKVVIATELNEDRSLFTVPQPQPSLTMPLLSCGYERISHLSSYTLKKMWKEARELVGSEGYILPLAGSTCPFARQVYNCRQPSKPVVVTLLPKKQKMVGRNFACEPSCSQYSFLSLCCHTVATAESNFLLREYVDFLGNSKEMPNLHQLTLKGNPRQGAGRKGGKQARTRKRSNKEITVLNTLPPHQSDTGRASNGPVNATLSASSWGTSANGGAAYVHPAATSTASYPAATSTMLPPWGTSANGGAAYANPAATSAASPKSKYPDPHAGVFHISLLQLCPPQVAKCYGCGQLLKLNGRICQPPYDLVIVTKMNREFRTANGDKQSKVSNVYFHCSARCVRNKQPYFLPNVCICPPEIVDLLEQSHRDVIRQELGL